MNNYMGTVEFFEKNSQAFWFSVYMPIAIWLLLVLTFFIILLRKYTFGTWTPEHPNPFEGETFQMPRGVFRGILTLTLLFVTIIIEMTNVKIIGLEQEIHELMVAFQMMIAFYFGSKVMHHITSVEKSKMKYLTQSNTTIEAGSDVVSSDNYYPTANNNHNDFNSADAKG